MAYFHSPIPVRKRGREYISVLGETREEILSAGRAYPDDVLINMPPRGRDSYRSRSLPQIYVPADRMDILGALESCLVSPDYMPVLRMMLREAIYNEVHGETEESRKFFQLEIRGKVIQLLRSGSWVDEPSSLSLKKLNSRIEKCDLGRRSDLNFSSNPVPLSKLQKYDQDFKVTKDGDVVDRHEHEAPDWNELYRYGSPDTRNEILENRPWMRTSLVELYGPPEDGAP
jgi:hypothetical protein